MSESDLKLPKDCPHCGGSMENGYGRFILEERGRLYEGSQHYGIYGQEDQDWVGCRACFAFVRRLLEVLHNANFHYYRAGRNSMREEKHE